MMAATVFQCGHLLSINDVYFNYGTRIFILLDNLAFDIVFGRLQN